MLSKELAKAKPKVDVVQNLIRRTLTPRRKKVMDGCRPEQLLEIYPHLRKANYVSVFNSLSKQSSEWGGPTMHAVS